MSDTYKAQVDYAEALAGIAVRKCARGEKNAFLPLLFGIGSYHVGEGCEHNYQAVVDAIHNLKIPETHTYFQDGLVAAAHAAVSFEKFVLVVDIFLYECRLEKKRKARFQKRGYKPPLFDRGKVLAEIEKTLQENRASYTKENARFEEWLEGVKEYAKKEYKIEI